MNKMTIIQLLNKIANGEEVPEKIKINDEIWIYDDDIDYRASDDRGYLFEVYARLNEEDLNEELEVIEEDKKIKELVASSTNSFNQALVDKINEIIKYLNKEE